MRNLTVEWFGDPDEAVRKLDEANQRLTPAERVSETMRLMELVAGWKKDGRITRTTRIIDVP
jgi:hypothetical protein